MISNFNLAKSIYNISNTQGKLISVWTPVTFSKKLIKFDTGDNLNNWIRDKSKFMILLWEKELILIRLDKNNYPMNSILSYKVEKTNDTDELIYEGQNLRVRIAGYNYHVLEFLYEHDLQSYCMFEWIIIAVF